MSAICFDCDRGSGAAATGKPDWQVVVPHCPDDIYKRLFALCANPGDVATVLIDSITTYFTMGKSDQHPAGASIASRPGDWGKLDWGQLIGQWQDIVAKGVELTEKHGINFVVVGHIKADYVTVGRAPDGLAIKKLLGWTLEVPGNGDNDILVPFDETYLLQEQVGGGVQLHARKTMFDGYAFKAKSRYGVASPLAGTREKPLSYDAIIAALPTQSPRPRKFALVGEPGVGKTRLAFTFPTRRA